MSKVVHIHGREPAAKVLHAPHESSDGFLQPSEKRIEALTAALEAIKGEAIDLEHAKILAYSALRLDAGGAIGARGHLRRWVDNQRGEERRRQRRFLTLEVESESTSEVCQLVQRHVYAIHYEGVIGKEPLAELPAAVKRAPASPSKALLQKYLQKWKKSVTLDGAVLADICDALIEELSLDRTGWSAGDWCHFLEGEATLGVAEEDYRTAIREMAIEVRNGKYAVPEELRREVLEYLTTVGGGTAKKRRR